MNTATRSPGASRKALFEEKKIMMIEFSDAEYKKCLLQSLVKIAEHSFTALKLHHVTLRTFAYVFEAR